MSKDRSPYREAAELPEIPHSSWLQRHWPAKALLALSVMVAFDVIAYKYMQAHPPKPNPEHCVSRSSVLGRGEAANCDGYMQTQPLNNNTDSVLVTCQCENMISVANATPEPPVVSSATSVTKPKRKEEPTLDEITAWTNSGEPLFDEWKAKHVTRLRSP